MRLFIFGILGEVYSPGYSGRFTVPGRYVKGMRCRTTDTGTRPQGCTHTGQWVEVYVENELAGPTFYWR